MDLMHTYQVRGTGSISLNDYVALSDKASRGADIGLFESLWDLIKDFVCGTHICESKALLLSILSEQTPDSERLVNFRELQGIIRCGVYPTLVEFAEQDGVTIRIMSSLSCRTDVPKTVCLYKRFIPATSDVCLPGEETNGVSSFNDGWDYGFLAYNDDENLALMCDNFDIDLVIGSLFLEEKSNLIESNDSSQVSITSGEEIESDPIRRELWNSAPNQYYYQLVFDDDA